MRECMLLLRFAKRVDRRELKPPPLCALLLLFLLVNVRLPSSGAEKVWLLNTKNATSELNWRTWSNRDESDGWLEETSYSKRDNVNYQVYSTCNLDHSEIENWLLIPRLDTGEANRLYIELEFTIRKCQAVPNAKGGGCRETLKLYAAALRQGEDLQQEWVNDGRWRVIDTVVANSDEEKINIQTSPFPVSTPHVHFALKNSGACSSILSVKVYYEVCPSLESELVKLPRTVTARDARSFVTVGGQCLHNASPTQSGLAAVSPPTAICKVDGTWQMVGDVRCECSPGYIPSLKTGLCAACGVGTYKLKGGVGECMPCPRGSISTASGSRVCKCEEGLSRRATANVSEPCYPPQGSILTSSSEGLGFDDFKVGIEGDEGRKIFPSRSDEEKGNGDWFRDLFNNGGREAQRVWPWLMLCLLVVLLLCCALLLISQFTSSTRKQMSDLDALDNYKQGTITPDYARSSGGSLQPNSALPGTGLRRKLHIPLIPAAYGTQQTPPGQTSISKQYRPYVDPRTYEDPSQALQEFTNEIQPTHVEVTRVIGAGEFGEVCCGRLTTLGVYGTAQQQIVAVKTLLPGSTPKARADFLTEASTMGQFEHENVVHLIGVVTKSEPVMLITEYMLNGSLDKFLVTNDSQLDASQMVAMLQGIACGMRYLTEQKGFVHRDLAARNILVDDRLTCKIADFGLSRGLSAAAGGEDSLSSCEQHYYTSKGGKIPIRWTAPEAITFHKYTAASDVWSYGIVMWEVFSFGQRPYWEWSNQKVIEEVKAGFRLPIPADCPDSLYNLMLSCWQEERQRRPTFSSILSQLGAYLANEYDSTADSSRRHESYGYQHRLSNSSATLTPTQRYQFHHHRNHTIAMQPVGRDGTLHSPLHSIIHRPVPTPPALPLRPKTAAVMRQRSPLFPPLPPPPPQLNAAVMMVECGGTGSCSDLNFFV